MSASTQMQPSLPVRMKARRNMLFIVLLVVLMTVVVLPSQAFAMVENDGARVRRHALRPQVPKSITRHVFRQADGEAMSAA